MCIREEEEWYVMSKTLWITPLCYVEVGEALGPYHTMLWINDLQLANDDFEVDPKKVADYYVRNRGDLIEFGANMYRRQTNEVAHALTHIVTSCVPCCITDLIYSEMLQAHFSKINLKSYSFIKFVFPQIFIYSLNM